MERTERSETECVPFVKVRRPMGTDGLGERWDFRETSPTLNAFDNAGETRAVVLAVVTGK